MSFNPFSSLIDKLKHDLSTLGDGITRNVGVARDAALAKVHDMEGTALSAVRTAATDSAHTIASAATDFHKVSADAETAIERAAEGALSGLPAGIRKAIASELGKLAGGLAGPVLKRAAHWVSTFLPSAYTLTLGPLTLAWNSIGDDAVKLGAAFASWASKPPSGKAALMELIDDTGPDQVTLSVSAALAFLFVESGDLGAGTSMSFDKAQYEKVLSALLDELGLK